MVERALQESYRVFLVVGHVFLDDCVGWFSFGVEPDEADGWEGWAQAGWSASFCGEVDHIWVKNALLSEI